MLLFFFIGIPTINAPECKLIMVEVGGSEKEVQSLILKARYLLYTNNLESE